MNEDQIKAIAIKLQPKMARWLENSLRPYNIGFEDSMRIVIMLLQSGAEAARIRLNEMTSKITVVQ